MVLRFVDTHCHLDFECFQANLDEVVQEAMAVGVERFLIPGTRASGWAYQRGICERYPSRLFPALGVHPYFVRQHAACSSADLERELTLSNGVYEAIGKLGWMADRLIRSPFSRRYLSYISSLPWRMTCHC